jgi:hypothetical protein
MDPWVDIPLLKANIASRSAVQEVHRFVRMASKQAPEVSRPAIVAQIALPPFQWYLSSNTARWRRAWGNDSSWVPHDVVKFPNFRELIIVVEGKMASEMLDEAWRVRTIAV